MSADGYLPASDVETADVVIVGGGVPSLVLATQIAKDAPDLSVLVLESADATARNPQGVLVHPATQLLLERCGMSLPSAAEPGWVEWLEEYRHGRRIGRFDVKHHANDRDACYAPYNIGLAALVDAAMPVFGTLANCEIRYATTVVEAKGGEGGWTLVTAGVDGARQSLRTSLLVAGDGANSALRTTSAIEFVRQRFPGHVDVIAVPERRPDPPAISMMVGKRATTTIVDNGMGPNTLLFDMQPDGQAPDSAEVRLRPDMVERVRTAGLDIAGTSSPLFSTSIQSSTVQCDCWYRDGMLLLGDAAHAMHNLGGQGFNIAVQNAAALAGPLRTLLRTGAASGMREFEDYRLPYVTELQDRQNAFFNGLAEGRVDDESWLRPLHEALTRGQPGLDRYVESLGELSGHA